MPLIAFLFPGRGSYLFIVINLLSFVGIYLLWTGINKKKKLMIIIPIIIAIGFFTMVEFSVTERSAKLVEIDTKVPAIEGKPAIYKTSYSWNKGTYFHR